MLLYRIARTICRWCCKLFFHLEVKGKSNIPGRGGFILASNHASFLDPIVLGSACPRALNFAARDSLFKNPLLKALISRVGAFPIRRWSADLSAVRESVRRLEHKGGLVVFPEGTRSANGQLQSITHGFVLLASKANVPIVPAWISGSYKAWSKGSKIIRPAKITVIFGKPIKVLKGQSYAAAAEDIFRQIRQLSCF